MAHEHHHDHDHHHDHHHGGDGYYLEQICLIAIAGAFGAVCLTLYFLRDVNGMLYRMLASPFHLYILASGIMLMAIVLVRAAGLWREAGVAAQHQHDHDHPHEGHDHGHNHSHDDDHDHDHAWTPLKCVVLLAPILIYLLGLPTSLTARSDNAKLDMSQDMSDYSSIVSLGFNPLNFLTAYAAHSENVPTQPDAEVTFRELEDAAMTADRRDYWKNKWVEVRGIYAPRPQSNRQFSLVRFNIQCCGADAIPLQVRIISKQPILDKTRGDWVKVMGRIGFRKDLSSDRHITVLSVPGNKWVKQCEPDLNPYDQ